MKHFIALLVVCLTGYFFWAYATRSTRRETSRFLRRHGLAVAFILLVLLAALSAAMLTRSISIF